MLSKRIFIVEDSFIVSLHLQKTLENEGYEILGIADAGEIAIEQIKSTQPDLVLMDIMLNGNMDGIQTASLIKDTLAIPVVFITALTDRDTIQRAKIAEPYGYVTKPFEDREIFTVIEMALYKGGIERKLRQSEEKFNSTLKSISDCVLTIDKGFNVTYANPGAENLIGLALEDMMGKSIFEVVRLKNYRTGDYPVNPIQCSIEDAHQSKWPENLILFTYHGKELPVTEGTINSIADSSDQSVGLVLTFKDGMERLRHQQLKEELEIQQLSARMEGQENERHRIAKDLHDGLGQMLSAIKMNIQTFVSEEEKAKGLFTLLDEAITETKRISENLLPHKLLDFDLETCLNSLCDQMQTGTSSQITFLSFTESSHMPETSKINLYRIAQEALNNAIRHAKAQHISVQLFNDEYGIRLTVEDDGGGMDDINETKGRGLTNIRDRARVLRGECTIHSDRKGTIILVEIPK